VILVDSNVLIALVDEHDALRPAWPSGEAQAQTTGIA
jgi:hypothetical protein